jgi:putative ABC transport system substrate-binding protein
VAILMAGSRGGPVATAATPAAVLVSKRLAALGYVDGQSIELEDHYADGDLQRLDQLARELAGSKPDVIVSIAVLATLAARRATGDIPIVMAHAGDPVGAGLAASLSRPGGNVTGTTSMVPDLGAKQVELLHQVVPRLSRLGVLLNPTNPGHRAQIANVKQAARGLDIDIVVAEVSRAQDFDAALARLGQSRLDAVFVMMDPSVDLNRARVLDFVQAQRLPASVDVGREMVRQGGLMSYGPVLTSHYALVADYVDKILKGARPGDLPIQQPTEFALVINLRTAELLGLKIPQALLVRADELVR